MIQIQYEGFCRVTDPTSSRGFVCLLSCLGQGREARAQVEGDRSHE